MGPGDRGSGSPSWETAGDGLLPLSGEEGKGWWSGREMTLPSLMDLRQSQDFWFDHSAPQIPQLE